MAIEKTRHLMRESVYLVNMNTGIENTIKWCDTCLEHQQTQPHKEIIPYEVPCKPWEVVGAGIFFVKYYTVLCIVHYYSRIPAVQ